MKPEHPHYMAAVDLETARDLIVRELEDLEGGFGPTPSRLKLASQALFDAMLKFYRTPARTRCAHFFIDDEKEQYVCGLNRGHLGEHVQRDGRATWPQAEPEAEPGRSGE